MFYLFGHLLPVDKIFQMGYTPAEFKKTLLGQFSLKTPYVSKEESSYHWLISSDEGDFLAKVMLKEMPLRKIAMLSLPVLQVHFQFNKASDHQQKQFLSTFFKYFHKGGG